MPCVYPRSPAMLLSPKIISAAGQLKSPAMQDINDCMALSTADVPEHTAVLESIHFFNTRLLPEVAPAHAPFQRVHIAAAGWLTMIMSPQHASHRYSCSRRSLIPTSCDFVARRRAQLQEMKPPELQHSTTSKSLSPSSTLFHGSLAY
jgi:hypothetical protein